MKHLKLTVTVVLATVFLVAGLAFSQGPPTQVTGNQGPPRYGCQQRFHSLDANHDGKLTRAEFMAAPHWRNNPGQMFDAKDVKGRGYLTKDEFCWGPGGRGMGGRMGRGPGMGMGMNQ